MLLNFASIGFNVKMRFPGTVVCISINLVLERQKQEDQEFRASWIHIMSSRQAWAMWGDTLPPISSKAKYHK